MLMVSKLKLVFCAVVAAGVGYGMFMFWNSIRPGDVWTIRYGAPFATALAAFVAVYFLTKGGGGE